MQSDLTYQSKGYAKYVPVGIAIPSKAKRKKREGGEIPGSKKQSMDYNCKAKKSNAKEISPPPHCSCFARKMR